MLRALSRIGLGAGLMYFLDADTGRRRRAMVRDRLVSVLHDAEDVIGKGTRDINHRVTGSMAGLRGLLAPNAYVPDDVLVARVRSRLGRVVSHPHAIQVAADNGHITLRGVILAAEVPGLLAATETAAGVTGVDNQLEAHGDPTGIPGLQGEGRALSSRLLPGTWSPAARLIAGIIGLRAARMGLSRGGLLGTIVGLGGIGMLYRAFTNPNHQRLVPWEGGPGGVEIEKTITLKAPVAEVFELWRNPENFPRFMSHLVEVKRLDDRRHHWVAKGPAGVPAEWDSEITQLEPNRIVAWKSLPGSMVETAGHIRFEAQGDATRIDIRLRYHPPAGTLGHLVAAIFGMDPKHAMDEDLVRLKSLLEQGKTRVAGHTVTREQAGVAQQERQPPAG